MCASKTQSQQEAKNALHHRPAQRPGEEVQREAVFVNIREGRVLQRPQAERDTGQDLVPEQESKDQASPGVRD